MKRPTGEPLIYLVTDGSITNENFSSRSEAFIRLVEAAVSAHISYVQIREKQLSARLLFELAKRAARLTRGTGTKLLVNDRADIALSAGADGVHLTALSIKPEVIRRSFPADFVIGVSTHSVGDLVTAKNSNANFAVFGPIFETPGKGSPLGLSALRDAVKKLDPFPVIAIGGIDLSNYKQILEVGAAGFAAIRFLNDAGNLERLGKDFHL